MNPISQTIIGLLELAKQLAIQDADYELAASLRDTAQKLRDKPNPIKPMSAWKIVAATLDRADELKTKMKNGGSKGKRRKT